MTSLAEVTRRAFSRAHASAKAQQSALITVTVKQTPRKARPVWRGMTYITVTPPCHYVKWNVRRDPNSDVTNFNHFCHASDPQVVMANTKQL